MRHLSVEEAHEFAERWLPAWTGNEPERLVGFYADDVFYLDPGIPEGVRGKAELLDYFRKLLANNPDWVWEQTDAVPLEDGFLNKWRAVIPVGDTTVRTEGVCLVQFDNKGLIKRNEVYFDRSVLLKKIAE